MPAVKFPSSQGRKPPDYSRRHGLVLAALGGVVLLSAAGVLSADPPKIDPQQLDQRLGRTAALLGEEGLGYYKWPKAFQKVAFQTTGAQGNLESTATVTCTDNKAQEMSVCVLIVAEAYGVFLSQNYAFKKAIVIVKTPAGEAKVDLPLEACKALGVELLAKKPDQEKFKDAQFRFILAANHAELDKLAQPDPQRKNLEQFKPFMQAMDRAKKLEEKGDDQAACKEWEKVVELGKSLLGKDHDLTVQAMNFLAISYANLGRHDQAELLFLRYLEFQEAKLGKDHPDVARVLNRLGYLYRVTGRQAQAQSFYERGLKIREAKHGKDHPDVAESLHDLAVLYEDLGRPDQAEPLLKRALEIRESKLGRDHSQTFDTLLRLTTFYFNTKQHDQAESFLQRLTQSASKADDPLRSADALYVLAIFSMQADKYKEAEQHLQSCLTLVKSKLGEDHPRAIAVMQALAGVHTLMGRYDEAEPLLRRSLQMLEKKFGKDNQALYPPLSGLANLYEKMGRHEQAESLYQRALDIAERTYGKDNHHLTLPLQRLSRLHAAKDEWEAAARLAHRERRIARKQMVHTMPLLSEKEQLNFFLDHEALPFWTAQSLGWAQKNNPTIVDLSAGWIVNGKAGFHQALAERNLLARDAVDPKLRQIARELVALRRQLASLSLSESKPELSEERQKQFDRLADKEQELSRQLGQAAGRATRPDPWIDLQEIRAALPPGSVLVEISRFAALNFKAKENEKKGDYRYAAWLIPAAKEGEIRLIDLGDADKIEQAVAVARNRLKEAQDPKESPILRMGEPEAEKALRKPLEDLARLILEPLLPVLEKKEKWFISPDASLWLVPWAALPLKDGSYAVEKHRISYLVSGRDLAAPALKIEPARPMILADPDYDLSLAEARAASGEILNEPAAVAVIRGGTPSSKLPIVRRLPGTAAEATAIKPKLERYAGAEPWVYKDRNALEAVFKSFKSPKVLVLSTHGFFLEDQDAVLEKLLEQAGGERSSKNRMLENPLLRCGLLLAGCNQRDVKLGENDEDGVLTGLEIVGTDLRGTELVVLSACETGLGQVKNGEGVAGLRQAFQMAGARAVVATLWQIPDRDTTLLMSEFFDRLAAGKSKADALREAQLARIKARRERHGAAHPFFWAAFTLTGE